MVSGSSGEAAPESSSSSGTGELGVWEGVFVLSDVDGPGSEGRAILDDEQRTQSSLLDEK